MPTIEITQSGRGGSIYYREQQHVAAFDWQFALPPTLALIFGPTAAAWDGQHPWAAGRQREIYEAVATAAARRRADGAPFALDLERGVIEIAHPRTPNVPRAIQRRRTPAPSPERIEEISVAALREAVNDRLSIDRRLVAAAALHRIDPSFDLERVLARAIRALDRPANGLGRALTLAESHDTPAVRQALLWASWNATDCAPACAALLLKLTGADARAPDDMRRRVLAHLGAHSSYFERRDAFDALRALVGMELDEGGWQE
ncbi:hypothetical protein J421_6346 (plasmid) [Gemmatirosa kalamazoonensis]|uniref:Uncharacterized protein n=1 Tax=Gemmatirosa kalamazoonensis TaxID=861299 RepID=W0RT64_9BACT|nr:hypothetical protein [Gemmatirosa kalamazoonensis]AHG93881.1 hypothetical protein J421_6346 [Gemmatirosa kalamazoonensis]